MLNVSVVVDDGHADDLERVAERLRASGMAVDAVLGEVGIITGSVRPQDLAAVQEVEGVASVTADRTVRLEPPDSDIQ
ncbi:ketohydroxyglutarate aldolase [Cryobacterium frigoriphilum]|uniref:Ketohydroxyglutarate aldolase n=1 Tax=Cryobacterium frigoriphilum TaxID=1259150 RepID=A0A4R9A8H7_9MICO|nr:ketohydroxyglutarate aldolase [Cryobacterium frigoriphilum]TFD53947.1 ketohydroxyglutarate aldolase [Cryobacterium frigoriphilum]